MGEGRSVWRPGTDFILGLLFVHTKFGSEHGSLGGDELAVLDGMEFYLGLHDPCNVTLFYSYAVLKQWELGCVTNKSFVKENLECLGDWEKVGARN